MTQLKALETKLATWFKGAPALPESSKESLVKAWPYLALIFGVLQLLAAWSLYGLIRIANTYLDYANTMSVYYTGKTVGPTSLDKTVIYLGIVILLIDAVIMLMAYAPLTKRLRKGWDLLFLAAVVNVVYAVVTVFIDGRGIGGLFFSLLASVLGFYLLFQIQSKYDGKVPAAAAPLKPLENQEVKTDKPDNKSV